MNVALHGPVPRSDHADYGYSFFHIGEVPLKQKITTLTSLKCLVFCLSVTFHITQLLFKIKILISALMCILRLATSVFNFINVNESFLKWWSLKLLDIEFHENRQFYHSLFPGIIDVE